MICHDSEFYTSLERRVALRAVPRQRQTRTPMKRFRGNCRRNLPASCQHKTLTCCFYTILRGFDSLSLRQLQLPSHCFSCVIFQGNSKAGSVLASIDMVWRPKCQLFASFFSCPSRITNSRPNCELTRHRTTRTSTVFSLRYEGHCSINNSPRRHSREVTRPRWCASDCC
jgi:hypothetical protein